MARALMFQGTASHVGKSVLAAAFCRILHQDGYRVAPFKAQNMALNAAVTSDGLEIGRAQALQAQAAGVEPTVDMNPILLKPKADVRSQVIMLGRPIGDLSWQEYKGEAHSVALETVRAAAERLAAQYEVIVAEGAGSPAEVNLRRWDLANMTTAKLLGAAVILVADIDRGGVFASLVGTLDLLEPEERARVKGLIINRFRGDPTLFADGVRWLEEHTGVPVVGVVPYLHDLGLDEEDSVGLTDKEEGGAADMLEIAVIHLPRISNFNDFDPLTAEPGVAIRYVDRPEALGYPDAVILPGTKDTVDDLRWLYARGLVGPIIRLASAGVPVVGICGGFQMLGREVRDEQGIESAPGVTPGLELLPVITHFEAEKRTVRSQGAAMGVDVRGYEIHMGQTVYLEGAHPFATLSDGRPDGALHGEIFGTYLHGLFEATPFRRRWLNRLRERRGMPALPESGNGADPREAALDRLADHVRRHVAVDRIRAMLEGRS